VSCGGCGIYFEGLDSQLNGLFEINAYWNDAFIAKPAPNQIQQAETKFRDGVTKARQARDRAIALLPPQKTG